VTPLTPPAFLWHTAEDTCVPVENSLAFAAALSRAKVPFELHVFPSGGHGFGGCKTQDLPPIPGLTQPDLTAVTQWKELFVNWLNRTLG